MLKKNDEITLTIDAMTTEGSGIGRHEGIAVFVPNTAVGDTVLCHIIKAKKNYAVGKAFKVFTASKDRVEPDCPVSAQCGGCCYRHVSYEAELAYKHRRVADAFERIGHLSVEVLPVRGSDETLRYRNKAQFPVQLDRNLNPVMGFYASNTHRVVPCENCVLQPESFGDVLTVVREWIIRRGITVYDEQTHKGLLRHVYIRQGHYSKELMVCLVVNGYGPEATAEFNRRPGVQGRKASPTSVPRVSFLVDALKDTIPGLQTLSINYNPAKTNVILGDETEVVYGDGFIEDTLLGCTFRISPKSFYQVNTPQAEVCTASRRRRRLGRRVLERVCQRVSKKAVQPTTPRTQEQTQLPNPSSSTSTVAPAPSALRWRTSAAGCTAWRSSPKRSRTRIATPRRTASRTPRSFAATPPQ